MALPLIYSVDSTLHAVFSNVKAHAVRSFSLPRHDLDRTSAGREDVWEDQLQRVRKWLKRSSHGPRDLWRP